MRKKMVCVLCLIMLITMGIIGCSTKQSASQTDIISQKIPVEGKIPVTVLVKFAFSINTFEEAAEKKFPQLDMIQVGNYTSDMGIAEYAARMEHDDLTDVVMTWPLEAGEEYWEERLVELSAFPFTEKYVTSMLNNISRDGKLYYLPGPSQMRGIIYNKTLFKENGWEVPSDFNGFVELCKKIEQTGIRSLQLGLGNAEVLDTAFMGYGYDSCLSKPQNAQWLTEYNKGQGSLGDNFTPAFAAFQTLIEEGILKPEDLNIRYSERENMLFNRECAMTEDSRLVAQMGYDYNGCTDEFALMPFFNPGEKSDWVRLYPVCYIGINKKMELPENKEKMDLIMQLLEYISTQEGQLALTGDTGAMFSSLNEGTVSGSPEIYDLLPALNHGRYAIFPTLKNAQNALREGLAGMVKGELTAEEVIAMTDAENLSKTSEAPPKVLGTASEDFTLIETGNFITDVMREQSGSEIALFLDDGKDGKHNARGVSGRIYRGDITKADITRILPDLKLEEKGELLQVVMTGENLQNVLEYAIPVNNDKSGWFYYFSGLRMEYAPAAEPGQRIRAITDEAGNAIEPNKKYTVAVMEYSVPDNRIESSKPMGVRISELLEQEITAEKEISPSGDGRFTVAEP